MKNITITLNALIAIIILWGILREGISFQSDIASSIARLVALSIFGINLLAILNTSKSSLIKTAKITNYVLIILGILGLLEATISNMQGAIIGGILILIICIVPAILNITVLRRV